MQLLSYSFTFKPNNPNDCVGQPKKYPVVLKPTILLHLIQMQLDGGVVDITNINYLMIYAKSFAEKAYHDTNQLVESLLVVG